MTFLVLLFVVLLLVTGGCVFWISDLLTERRELRNREARLRAVWRRGL